MLRSGRKYDLVLYGASGFTGKQTVEYCRQFAPSGLRWAIAGRNRAKLDAVNKALKSIESEGEISRETEGAMITVTASATKLPIRNIAIETGWD